MTGSDSTCCPPDAARYLRPGVPSGTGCGCAARLLNCPPGTERGGGGTQPGKGVGWGFGCAGIATQHYS